MTSLTSTIGFGGLALADYAGVRSIGYLASAGILSMLLATLTVMPLVLAFAERYGLSRLEAD
jgi:predicted RND superfamily exporter protein